MSQVVARGFAYMVLALILTVYGQLVVKWRIDVAGELPDGTGMVRFLVNVMLDPWVISSMLFAVIAAFAYLAALTDLPLSRAYPVMALSFVIVVLASAPLFGEGLNAAKVVGVTLIAVGVLIASSGV